MFAFPKNRRLIKTDDYSSVFNFRKAFRETHFFVHYCTREASNDKEKKEARLGLIVAKRFLPKAVARNLIKRLAREQFRQMANKLKNCDVIVRLAKKPENLTKTTRKRLSEELARLLKKLMQQNENAGETQK